MEAPSMDKLNELLPGIEEFLVQILPQESLSAVAEERRRYFVERLDILKLPPSLPPRAGKRLSLELLEESEEACGIPADTIPELRDVIPELRDVIPEVCDVIPEVRDVIPEAQDGIAEEQKPAVTEAEKDFAAKQREISRNLLASVSSDNDLEDTKESESIEGIKVYDDIDHSESTNQPEIENDDEDDDDDDNALYEIPVARQQLPPSSEDTTSQGAEACSQATGGSMDDINDEVLDASSPGWQPPPLPPRAKTGEGGGEGKGQPPELPFRPPLPRRNELPYAPRSLKSDKSEKSDASDGGDSTSYESFEENEQESELPSTLNVKLPKRQKKKTKAASNLLTNKHRSSSTWEINVPFKKLTSLTLSGEMQHKGKLTWNRRLVALSEGCLALYKPEKEARPVLVIPLSGFQAGVGEAVGRKGFEMRLSHPSGENYLFAVDFKEWAAQWCECINLTSQGLPVPTYHQHLARSFTSGTEQSPYDSKGNLSNSNSNLSVSSDGVESDDSNKPRTRANKVMRMGSFAYRATQFWENLGKKTSNKRKTSHLSLPLEGDRTLRADGIQEESSVSSVSSGIPAVSPSSGAVSPVSSGIPAVSPSSGAVSPVFEDSFRLSSELSTPVSSDPPPLPSTPPPDISIKHQGYLQVFSSFNRRRWGQRWCLVRDNEFQCYRTAQSQPCELHFPLKGCTMRQALQETNSPLAIMLLEDNREKITVEPVSAAELRGWLRVLLQETGVQHVPEGLEDYYAEGDSAEDRLTAAISLEYSDIVGASVTKSWEVGGGPILSNKHSESAELDADQPGGEGGRDRYVYTEVVKRSSSSTSEKPSPNNSESGEGKSNPPLADHLAVYNANKHTTDSGFYSVKGANSDSESGSEIKSEVVSPGSESCPPLDGGSVERQLEDSDRQLVCQLDNVSGEDGDMEKTLTGEDLQSLFASGAPSDLVPEGQREQCAVTEHKGRGQSDSSENTTHQGKSSREGTINTEGSVCPGMDSEGEIHRTVNSDNAVSRTMEGENIHQTKDACVRVSSDISAVDPGQHVDRNAILSDSQLCTNTVDQGSSSNTAHGISEATFSQEPAHKDKTKKKKRKSKSKKGKTKASEADGTAADQGKTIGAGSEVTAGSSKDLAPSAGISNSAVVASSAAETETSDSRSFEERLSESEAVQAVTGEVTMNGPEEDEVICDLRDRLGRLREKLVLIKRKRIAVRDKRVRVFSVEEREACDREYLVLESQCKEISANITQLQQQLDTATGGAV